MASTTKMYQIDVDEEVYNFLKNHAEPFKDTPNSVLRQFLPLKRDKVEIQDENIGEIFPKFPASVPNALAQILEMVILVKNEGLSRVEATKTVAEIRGITYQAVIDKYCRQLGEKAYEIDEMLMNTNIDKFRILLIDRFPYHSKVVDSVFNKISG